MLRKIEDFQKDWAYETESTMKVLNTLGRIARAKGDADGPKLRVSGMAPNADARRDARAHRA